MIKSIDIVSTPEYQKYNWDDIGLGVPMQAENGTIRMKLDGSRYLRIMKGNVVLGLEWSKDWPKDTFMQPVDINIHVEVL